ncbi:YcjF family protein [Paracoccus shanxieyensis]|uniref:TIGR01620 family protein n=1 Tax=Paracoccus shanxieyensis TaxID=2675752 RepID=A0A6L6IWJ0_9RHOB|nr:TIGR01620 family protein [Paracoccus shanxieyensis]MTH62737.1 TIGR01620 family protein [Paracoccus shanxieyensis]MTH86179.1 TIGR01620 family protein [Paracoccus shanxieyensis]
MSENGKRRGPVLIEMGTPEEPPRRSPGPVLDAPVMPETPPRPDEAARMDAPRQDERARRAPREAGGDIPSPADAPMIDDGLQAVLPEPRTMQLVQRLVGKGPSPMTRFFINTGVALFTFLLSVSALRYLSNLMNTYPLLGFVGFALMVLFCIAALGMAWREYRAWARFGAIDGINRAAGAAMASGDVKAAQDVVGKLEQLYRARPELEWGRGRLAQRKAEAYDAVTLISVAEAELLAPLDQQARREIEAAARTVAAATALIPLALADVIAALAANLRMIRRMAEIYGGRAGAVGGWRLARTVMTHLVATGAVAAGDDLIHTVAGGGILAKVSKRFGEGVVNGALTARVGIAAMEVCRPLPFVQQPRPTVGNLIARGLKGLFGDDAAK